MSGAHPDWCQRHRCHFDGGGAHHVDDKRRPLVHRYSDCVTGRYSDDGEDWSVGVSWHVYDDETLFSRSDGWSLTAEVDVLDGETMKSTRIRASIGDLRKIAQFLNAEADALDTWRIGEIARRAEDGDAR